MNKIYNSVARLLAGVAFFATAHQSFAQNIDFVADYLNFNENSQLAYLEGSVEIKTAAGYFYPTYVEYNLETEQLRTEGQLNGVLQSGDRFVAQFAELDFKTQQAILIEVKALLVSEMQVASQRIYDDDDVTYAENVVASSCVVCALKPVPIWQLRASQLLNDKAVKKIFLKHARFELYGLPVFYLPYIRIPSYAADRMSGFLPPTFVSVPQAEGGLDLPIGGFGVKIPYYISISDYTDAKISALVNVGATQLLEGRFRHNGKGYKLRVEGARSFYTGEGTQPSQYYAHGNVEFVLPFEFKGSADYTWQSDYDFQNKYDYPRLGYDQVHINRTQNSNYFEVLAKAYRPSSEANIPAEQPTVLPKINFGYNTELTRGLSSFTDLEYLKLNLENGADIARVSANSSLEYRKTFAPGIIVNGSIGAKANLYTLNEQSDESYTISQNANFSAKMPFAKTTPNGQHIVTPIASFMWQDYSQNGDLDINLDSQFHETDFIGLFDADFMFTQDRLMSGTQASLGITYQYFGSSGTVLGLGIARNWLDTFESAQNITELNPNDTWLGYTNWDWNSNWRVSDHFALNDDFGLTRNELSLNNHSEFSNYSLGWVWLDKEPDLGFDLPRSEFLLGGRYQFHPNWELGYNVNYDVLNWEPKDAKLALTYGNECIQVNLGIDFDLTAVDQSGLNADFDFSVDLFGLEKGRNKKWKKRECKY